MNRKTGARKIIRLLTLAALLFFAAPALVAAGAETLSLRGNGMTLEVRPDPFALCLRDPNGRAILETDGPASFTTVSDQRVWRFVLWWYWTPGVTAPWIRADRVVASHSAAGSLALDLGNQPGGTVLVRLTARFTEAGALRVEMEALHDGAPAVFVNRFRLSFKRGHDDRYYGMGERFNRVEHSGERVRVWSEEGGLGLGYLSVVWPNAPFNPFPKGPDTTYFPVPFFLDPAKGYGFLLDDVHPSVFDFGHSRHRSLRIENWNRRFDFMVFYGPSPLQVIEAQTAYTGRITVPPPWVFAPMNAAVLGEERVYQIAKEIRAEHIPTTAIWDEDWWWRTEWVVNQKRYPHYARMIADLHADGFRALSYFQPYISKNTAAFREGDSKGYFTRDREGKTYIFKLGLVDKAQLDLTNPAACKWWTESFFQMAVNYGIDGWMHDFGEHTPPDSVSFDSRSGWDLHNEYPVLWAKLARRFWDRARPDGDYCFYIRGGYTGVQRWASVMWTGDQNTNFEKLDGLPSNLPAIMSVGISGCPLATTDIAGYNCFVSKSTDRELFMRWTEFGALLPVMRIHRGNDEICNNWSFDQDRATLDHYKKYALLHTSLFPYFYTLARDAADHGWPIVRHLSLQYPDDPATWRLDYQFLLGDRVMVAPVIRRRARAWKVYFPEGQWAHWWTGKIYTGPSTAIVPAPLGELPLFVRAGKILPLFDSPVDTLVKVHRPDLKGFDDADASLKIVFYGTGRDNYTLWDGTSISCERTAAAPGSCTVTNAPHARNYTFDFR